jgi:hypothetical protein
MSVDDISEDYITYDTEIFKHGRVFESPKYIVGNEAEKADIIKKGLAAGIMPKLFSETLFKRYEDVIVEYELNVESTLESSFVLVHARSEYRYEIIESYKSLARNFIKKYVDIDSNN